MTLLAAMFAGCVKENTGNVESDGYVYEKGTIAFSLPAPGKKVTYTRAAAEAGEDDLENLVIYQFASGALEKVYATGINIPGAGTITISGSDNTNRIARINLASGAMGPRTFYLVANVNGATNSAQSNKLWSNTQQTVPAIGTPIGTFEDALRTNNLTDALALATPLPMSNMIDLVNPGTGVVVATVETPGYQEVTLKRRVARFDIVNHVQFTNLEVTGVVVKDGNLSGEILDQELSYTPATDDGEKELDANGSGNITTADYYDQVGFDPDLGLNEEGLAQSLTTARFYLYPTTVKAGATEIYLTGEFNGAKQVFPLTLTDPEAGVKIEANYVYQIVVERVGQLLRFSLLKVAPWEDYNDGKIKSGLSDEVEFSDLLDDSDLSKGDDYDFSDKASTEEVLHVVYKSTSNVPPVVNFAPADRGDGVVTEAGVLASTIDVATPPTPALETRAFGPSVYYETVITITLAAAQPGVPVGGKLTVAHPGIPALKREYTLSTVGRYDGIADLKPVLVDGKYWAPVNAGANTLVTDFSNGGGTPISREIANVGYYYQWGRNKGFYPPIDPMNTTTTQFSSITDADDSDEFYIGTLPNYLDGDITNLWSGTRAKGPCPTGWRVPTRDELVALVDGTDLVNSTTKVLTIPGAKQNEFLYIPASGRLYQDNLNAPSFVDVVYLYSGSAITGSYGHYVSISSISSTLGNGDQLQWGKPVRCLVN
jgi:hypothetical protein